MSTSPEIAAEFAALSPAPVLPPAPARPQSIGPVGAPDATGANAFVPLLLLSLAFAGWTAFQSVQLVLEHRQLAAAGASLATSEQQSVAVRRSLDSLASATAKLAESGNPNARRIVDELRNRGITINPSATGAPP